MIKSRLNCEAVSIRLGMIFSKAPISANTWTLLALLPAVGGFVMLYQHQLIVALILFALSGSFDAIDGAVARVTNSVSNLGAFLDGVTDRYVEILLYIGLLIYMPPIKLLSIPITVWIIGLVFGSLMPSFVRAYADHKRVVTEPEDHKKMGGLLERFERLILIYIGMFAGYFNVYYLAVMIGAVTILTNITALQRIVFVISHSR